MYKLINYKLINYRLLTSHISLSQVNVTGREKHTPPKGDSYISYRIETIVSHLL